MDKAHKKGLPTEPYAEKIMEGLAKKVKEDRILLALGRVGERMEFAATQAEKIKGDDDLSGKLIIRTSDAIAAGMDREDLVRVFDVMARDRVNSKIEPEDIMEMMMTVKSTIIKVQICSSAEKGTFLLLAIWKNEDILV